MATSKEECEDHPIISNHESLLNNLNNLNNNNNESAASIVTEKKEKIDRLAHLRHQSLLSYHTPDETRDDNTPHHPMRVAKVPHCQRDTKRQIAAADDMAFP